MWAYARDEIKKPLDDLIGKKCDKSKEKNAGEAAASKPEIGKADSKVGKTESKVGGVETTKSAPKVEAKKAPAPAKAPAPVKTAGGGKKK